MDEPSVLWRVEEAHVGLIELNRPDNRNSMTSDLLDGFAHAVRAIGDEPDVRVVVITGRGNCFSAGADFRSQIQRQDQRLKRLPHEQSWSMYAPFLSVRNIEVPTIAAMNGHAVGGGFGLALACDLRIANRQAKYGANFVRLGLTPGMGITGSLPQLVGEQRAQELLYTGRLFDGAEAEAMGLALKAVGSSEVMTEALLLARRIAENAPAAVRMTKAAIRDNSNWSIVDAARTEAFAQSASVATRDAREGMSALLDKRRPIFTGE